MNEHASAQDIVKPGHIFPLQACSGGVLERRGHTEGAIDLARLAGFKPGAVLCEIMNPDGTMMRGIKLCQFAARHSISMLSIEDIVTWRLMHESLIAEEASAVLPVDDYGSFNIAVFREKYGHREHVVLTRPGTPSEKNPLVRIHSSCLTGDLFASRRCDCHYQLHHSLKRISEEGGMLIYLNQEGRGIGLLNKIKAYALQENGYDTVAANQHLGLPVDARNYAIAADILRKHDMRHIRLMSGNPDKINGLIKYGIRVDIETMPSFEHDENRFYLQTKIEKMQHIRGYNHA
jgi:3,4-dihydroxy 2-butanone 4-phosphate synthase/GTP cyclohydrolase II